MATSFTFDGMTELIADLKALSPVIAREAGHIVQAAANGAATEIRSNYPSVEGNLRKGVVIEDKGPLRKRVRSRAPHAHLFEDGTVGRYTKSRAYRGTMPARPTLVPAAIKFRARMIEQLIAAVKRQKVRHTTGTIDVVHRAD